MKRFFVMGLCILSILTVIAYVGNVPAEAADKEVTLIVGNMATGQTNPYIMCLRWADEYLKGKGSTVKLNLQLEGILGNERELTESVMIGTVDIAQTADMSVTSFFPQMSFANFPKLFDSYDDVYKAWAQDGWAYQEAAKIMSTKGLTLLGAGDNGFRWITNSKRPIEKFEDMQGLKIRVPEVALLIDIWNEFGCLTAPISFTELTTALQQGVVDGQELGIQHFYSNGWYEFNRYMTQIDYDYSAVICFINTEKFNSLSKTQQTDLLEAFADANKKMIAYAVDFNNKAMEEIVKKHGGILTPMTPEFTERIRAVGAKIARMEKWTKILGDELVEKMYPTK